MKCVSKNYIKSLFLGWFEPLRDENAAEQERCMGPNMRAGYRPYFSQLLAEMMAVITMHKLMSLMMTGEGGRGVPVVQVACHIGEAIENEWSIRRTSIPDSRSCGHTRSYNREFFTSSGGH